MDPPNTDEGVILFEGSRKLPVPDDMGRICHCHMNNPLLTLFTSDAKSNSDIDCLSILLQPHTEVPLSAEK